MWEMHSRHMDMLLVNWLDMGVVPDAWHGASPAEQYSMLLRRPGTKGLTADRSRLCGASLRAAPRTG